MTIKKRALYYEKLVSYPIVVEASVGVRLPVSAIFLFATVVFAGWLAAPRSGPNRLDNQTPEL